MNNTINKILTNETQTNIHRNSDNGFILHRFSSINFKIRIMKLMSMVDFVLDQEKNRIENFIHETKLISYDKIERYANFLKQPLKLEMFLTCDEDGNLLKEDLFKNNSNFSTLNPFERAYLDKAKEKVLFEGFEVREDRNYNFLFNDYKTIEDLVKLNLTLTHNAEKLIK